MDSQSNFETPRIIETERGKRKLAYQGHMYTQDRKNSSGTVQFWRCEFKDKCKARLHTAVFVILADRGGYAIPLCYALLPNKSENSYRRMIDLVMGAFPSLNPASIAMDFEMAVINAFIAAFPNAEIHGCLFHLVKNVKKKLSSLNLLQRYNADSNFSLWSRMIPAMAFVREDLLDRSMMALLEVLPEELKPVYTYFELTRTNNFAEAAHRKLQGAFGVCHPSIWKFIDGLRHVQHKADAELERYNIGSARAPERRRHLNADANLP
ncbi:uncharacterized protein LOC108865065 [Galendromus occidentalis]|uniref:Uncharacterized protein LOC108865065 n=1 Tax=Galendromus occidentalis TaxID=34638 RepID=A0AAJ7PAX2_9ACAR|nr:uncharacterized protein LOC108865065 [Galendromus occidentalis]